MKFKSLDAAASHDGHERFVMHIGREESKLLIGLLTEAKNKMPKLESTAVVRDRIRQMERELRRVIYPAK